MRICPLADRDILKAAICCATLPGAADCRVAVQSAQAAGSAGGVGGAGGAGGFGVEKNTVSQRTTALPSRTV